MRRYFLSTIFFLSLPVLPVFAQNYIPSNGYSGAGIVVNMDVLNTPTPTLSGHPSPFGVTPTLSQPLPPVMPSRPATAAPVILRAPVRAPMAAPIPVPALIPAPPPEIAPPPALVAAPVAPAPKYTSPLAPIRDAVIAPPPSPAESVTKLAPPPAPLPEDLISDAPVTSPEMPPAAPVKTEDPATSGTRHELGSFHDPLPEDGEIIAARPPVSSVPQDEMAPVPSAVTVPSPVAPKPAYLSPTADRPGKKGGQQIPPAPAMPAPVKAPEASLPVAKSDNFEAYRLLFAPGSPDLQPQEQAILDKVVARMNAAPDLRLQVRAYAAGTPETAGAARRLSLSRALKIREYLIGKNVLATRLDVRALGSGTLEMGDEVGRGKAPADRVDLVFAE